MAEKTEMIVFNDGPVKVSGDFSLKDAQGRVFDLGGREAIALCRCGHSNNKPFCDGAHKAAEFKSTVNA